MPISKEEIEKTLMEAKEQELLHVIRLRNATLQDLCRVEDEISTTKNNIAVLQKHLSELEVISTLKDTSVMQLNDEIIELEMEI